MKNYNLFYYFALNLFLAFLFFGCNSPSNSISQNEGDSTKIVIASENSLENEVEQIRKQTLPFIEDNFSATIFPLKIDSVSFDGKKKLSTDFLLKLEKMTKGDENRYALQFPSFVKLNKLKKGQDPVESGDFDIGESVKVIHYDMGQTFLKEQNSWLAFVGVEYESYPACPWASGKEIVLCSFDTVGNLIDLCTIAERYEGGDPPVWGTGEKKVTSQNGIEYFLEIQNSSGEYDDNGERDVEEVEKSTQKISIQPNGKFKIEEPQKKK